MGIEQNRIFEMIEVIKNCFAAKSKTMNEINALNKL